jgi:hypothetical protein
VLDNLAECHPWLRDDLHTGEKGFLAMVLDAKPTTQAECRVLAIYFDIARLSPNLRLCPAVARSVKRAAQTAAKCAWLNARSPMVDGPIERVEWTIRRARAMDRTNAIASLKAVEDALFNRRRLGWGIGWDDSEKWIKEQHVTQETDKNWKGREHVLVRVLGVFTDETNKGEQ